MSRQPSPRRQAILARMRARKLLLQALYQWQISGDSPSVVYHNLLLEERNLTIEEEYFDDAWAFITASHQELDEAIRPFAERSLATFDPIEHAVLWIALYEIRMRGDIHPTITMDEAIELEKRFGCEDGYKFINGILDRYIKAQK